VEEWIVFSRWGESWWRIVSCLICDVRSILMASVRAAVSTRQPFGYKWVGVPFESPPPVFWRLRVYSC